MLVKVSLTPPTVSTVSTAVSGAPELTWRTRTELFGVTVPAAAVNGPPFCEYSPSVTVIGAAELSPVMVTGWEVVSVASATPAWSSKLNGSGVVSGKTLTRLPNVHCWPPLYAPAGRVVQTPVHRPVELTSLFDDLVRAGQEPSTTVLAYGIDPAPADIAGHLNLPAGTEVATIRRLRCSGGQPLAVMTNYLPVALAPDREELERAGLYQALRSRGVHIRLARQRIGAKGADREEARLLDEKPKSPLLVMERTAFDDSGRVVEYGSHVYRASRYFFDTTLVDR